MLALEAGPHARAADAVARLFVAEGAACGHACFWARADGGEGDASVWWLPPPRAQRPPRAAGDGDAGGVAPDLKIAWQYRRHIASARAAAEAAERGAPRPPRPPGAAAAALPAWCHEFDVGKPCADPVPGVTRCGADAGAAVDAAVAAARAARDPSAPPARIVLHLPADPGWRLGDAGVAASVLAVRRLRGAVRGARAVALVLFPSAALPHPSLAALHAAADAVLTVHCLRSDAPAASLLAGGADAVGFLAVPRPPRAGPHGGRPPPPPLHVLLRRRGRLVARVADVDPDAEAAAAAAAGGAPAAALACAATGGSGLDF